jgi:hypothetical protein
MGQRGLAFSLSILLALWAFLGSFASINSKWSWVGVGVSFAFFCLISTVCWILLTPIFRKNPRGINLLGALDDVGLVDIENRDHLNHALPPHQFYLTAEREIVITGVSALNTFTQHLDTLLDLLKSGKVVFVIILHPKSKHAEHMDAIEKRPVREEIFGVIGVVKRVGLNRHHGFKMKFFETLPSFTGVMIDGDVHPTGDFAQDAHGQMRVQPVRRHLTHHLGVVLQFRKKRKGPAGGFDFFAEDLRTQWNECREDPALLS